MQLYRYVVELICHHGAEVDLKLLFCRYGQQLTLIYEKLKQDDFEDEDDLEGGVDIEVTLTKSC